VSTTTEITLDLVADSDGKRYRFEVEVFEDTTTFYGVGGDAIVRSSDVPEYRAYLYDEFGNVVSQPRSWEIEQDASGRTTMTIDGRRFGSVMETLASRSIKPPDPFTLRTSTTTPAGSLTAVPAPVPSWNQGRTEKLLKHVTEAQENVADWAAELWSESKDEQADAASTLAGRLGALQAYVAMKRQNGTLTEDDVERVEQAFRRLTRRMRKFTA
jgi:hypothetical protein